MTKATESIDTRKQALRVGVIIFSLLAILTFGEFVVALIAPPWRFVLWIAAIWKALYVVKDYMHVGRVLGGEESH